MGKLPWTTIRAKDQNTAWLKEVISAQIKPNHGLVHLQYEKYFLDSLDFQTNDRKLRQLVITEEEPEKKH